ncbi:MAG TPA: TonB-dependent receptor [Acetobacteraceae bacterium]|nr:TonB-dependent receptor [Acetobacteraceae bacterium]
MRTIPALLATILTTPAILVTPALADESAATNQTVPPVVVTATRVPTPADDIPAGVTVITRQDIETYGYNTLVDALQSVPGLRVVQSGGPGGQASVFIRGSDSDAVLVLRDGMPINDAADSDGAFNFGVDTLADVQRIEIIRGPMAALYGSGAIGGVINLITRRGDRQGAHWEGDLSGGYPAQIRGSAVASGIEGPADYALILESQSQRGWDSTPQRESIYSGVPQGYRDRLATLNLGYTVVPGTRISLLLRAHQSIFGFDELGDPTFDDSNATGTDDNLLGRIGVTSNLLHGTWQTSVFLGREQEDRRYYEPLNPADVNNMAMVDDRYHSYRTDLQWNNTIHLNDMFHSDVLSATDLTFGFEHTADTAHVRLNDSYFGFPYMQSTSASMTDDAVYVGLQSTLWRRLTVTTQVRQDWEAPNAPTTWRAGAVFDASEIDTHFKASYGTAFRMPSLFDRYGVDSSGFVGNPNLKPESAQGWEAGFTTTLPAAGRSDFVSFGATYFNEQVTNLIVTEFVSATEDTPENINSAHLQGVESDLALHPARWLAVQGAWTYTIAKAIGGGEPLLRRPRDSASVTAVFTPLPGLKIAPELDYTGPFEDFLVNDQGYSTADIVTSPHGLIANLTVTYDVRPQVQIYLNGTNLFYSKFEPANGYQTPGPTVVAGVRVRL